MGPSSFPAMALIFGPAIGCALFAAVLLYVEDRRLYWREREREALYLAAVEAAALAAVQRRKRPVVPFRRAA